MILNKWQRLDERNKQVYELRASGKTLEEVGEQFGVTRERVRQIANDYADLMGLPLIKSDRSRTEMFVNRQAKARQKRREERATLDMLPAGNAIKRRDKKNNWRSIGVDKNFTVDDYNCMWAAQRGLCKICGSEGGKKGLHVDHDHATGVVRGLLCGRCNMGMGQFDDSIANLQKVIAYLDASRLQLVSLGC